MPRDEKVVSIFVASPRDVQEERDRLDKIVQDINTTHTRPLGIRLEVLRWEREASPGFGTDAQAVINDQIPPYDIFIGILWHTIGSPTPRAESGTIEEFERAKVRHDQDPNSMHLMLYFKTAAPPSLKAIDPEQLGRVNAFKARASEAGGLYSEFATADDFANQVQIALIKYIFKYISDGRKHEEEKGQPDDTKGKEIERISVEAQQLRLFFCHSSRDNAFVRELIGTLPPIVQSWIDENEIRLAEHLRDVLRSAIESSSLMVAILSDDSIDSEWVKYELQTAIENEVKILPIVIDPISDRLPEFIRERRYLYLPNHSQNQVEMVSDELCEEIALWMIENDPMTLLFKEQSYLLQAAAIEEGRDAASVGLALAEFIPKMIRAVYLKEYARIEDQHMPPLWLIQCANLVIYDLQTSPIAREGSADPTALAFIHHSKVLVDQCFFIGYYVMSFRRPIVGINVDDSQEYDVEKISLVFDELITETRSGNTDLSGSDVEIWNLGLRWIAIMYKALGRENVIPDSENIESVLLKAMFSGVTMARAVERIALGK